MIRELVSLKDEESARTLLVGVLKVEEYLLKERFDTKKPGTMSA